VGRGGLSGEDRRAEMAGELSGDGRPVRGDEPNFGSVVGSEKSQKREASGVKKKGSQGASPVTLVKGRWNRSPSPCLETHPGEGKGQIARREAF